jgi:hypothetical protein
VTWVLLGESGPGKKEGEQGEDRESGDFETLHTLSQRDKDFGQGSDLILWIIISSSLNLKSHLQYPNFHNLMIFLCLVQFSLLISI